NNIQGLIHDQSSSGKAVFVEPFQIVELNNEIATLRISESLEIERILKAFTIRVGGEAQNIRQNFDVLTDLDVIFAKALYAHSLKAERPVINNNGIMIIKNGRHPLIEKEKVVPITLAIEQGKKVFMVTGPNTGGKTVTLKLIGLFSIMTMCGIYPPCDYGSKIAIYNQIFSDIGDEQSIEQSLSTFSSHLVNIVDITNKADNNTLVLIDELGAGTDPIEGASLALAVTEKLVEIGATSVITTHYQQMKEYALTHDIVECASMDFDPVTFAPTYKLLLGGTGSSNAIQIAQRLGLDKSIVDRAKSLLSEDKVKFDAIILSAEKARRQANAEKAEIERLKMEIVKEHNLARQGREIVESERQKLNETMRKEAKRILQDYLDEAEEALEQIKKIAQNPTEQGLFEARRLNSKLNKLSYDDESNEKIQEYDNSPIKIGDSVYITSLDKTAIIVADDKRKAEYTVKIGLMTTNVKYGKVKKIVAKPQKTKETKKTVVVNKPINNTQLPLECNVIGKRVDEALQIVEKYLDSAVLKGMHEVRIVHGKGSGALRMAIHDYFKTHPSIATFRLGQYGEGEWGVTIAELK
ncbi:MAG: Smr/MutS family protein, partial [Clostridia bacterium]|nr:Smr/MutS family protein [Clostridia bacterium]